MSCMLTHHFKFAGLGSAVKCPCCLCCPGGWRSVALVVAHLRSASLSLVPRVCLSVQAKRTATFFEFMKKKTGVLCCTDVAARGLDIPEVDWIVQCVAVLVVPCGGACWLVAWIVNVCSLICSYSITSELACAPGPPTSVLSVPGFFDVLFARFACLLAGWPAGFVA